MAVPRGRGLGHWSHSLPGPWSVEALLAGPPATEIAGIADGLAHMEGRFGFEVSRTHFRVVKSRHLLRAPA